MSGKPQVQFGVILAGSFIYFISFNLDYRHFLLKNLFLCQIFAGMLVE